MTERLFSASFLFVIAAAVAIVVATAVALMAPVMAVPLVAGIVAVTIFIYDPRKIIYFAIFLLPFQNAPALTGDLFGIPGAKLLNVVLAGTLIVSYFDRPPGRSSDWIERRAMLWLGIYLAIFAFEFARSIGNLSLFSMVMPDLFHADLLRYLLSFFVKPLLFVVPFVFVLRNMLHDTDGVVRAIGIAIFLLSATIMAAILQDPGVLSRGRHAMADLCLDLLGMHYNLVGTVYITVGPLLLYTALQRGVFGKVNLALAMVVLLSIQSRSSLLAFVLALAITLIVLRHTLLLTVSVVVVGALLAVWQGPTTAALLSIGVNETGGTGVSLDDMFMGRIDAVWIPLIRHWFSDPSLLIFGAGRYAILTTPFFQQGETFQVTHAHNAFVDFFIDSGIVLTIGLVACIVAWLAWTWRLGRAMQGPLFWALFMCPVAYLMGTLTERQFYPAVDNMFLFPIFALMLNTIRTWSYETADEEAEEEPDELPLLTTQ